MNERDSIASEIAQIAEVLVRFGGGDLEARVPAESRHAIVEKLAFVVNLTIDELAARVDESEKHIAALNSRAEQLSAQQQELKDANEKLIKAQDRLRHVGKLAALGEISAMLAHELNQPLSAIIGYASLLLTPDPDPLPEHRQQDVRQISTSAAQMREIIQNLTRFSRDDAAANRAVDAEEPLRAALDLLKYQLSKAGIQHKVSMWGSLPRAHMDPSMCQQVFINLLANARDALQLLSPGSPKRIEVEIKEERGTVCYRVRDSGPGIPDEVRPKIFEPFFTTKPHEAGTGLGLALSRDIVARMGGRLELEEDGDGTCFVLRLLAAPDDS